MRGLCQFIRTGVSVIYGKGTTVSGLCQYMALVSVLSMLRDCSERVVSVYRTDVSVICGKGTTVSIYGTGFSVIYGKGLQWEGGVRY